MLFTVSELLLRLMNLPQQPDQTDFNYRVSLMVQDVESAIAMIAAHHGAKCVDLSRTEFCSFFFKTTGSGVSAIECRLRRELAVAGLAHVVTIMRIGQTSEFELRVHMGLQPGTIAYIHEVIRGWVGLIGIRMTGWEVTIVGSSPPGSAAANA